MGASKCMVLWQVWLNRSCISPNFSIFIVFFYYVFFFKINFNLRNLINGLLICIFLSLPVFFYLFILDVNFLLAKTPGVDELTSKITKSFHDDCNYLNCLKPSFEPRATEHIKGMINMTKNLLKNNNCHSRKKN